jgi:oligopeptide transport system substrate-binding protein
MNTLLKNRLSRLAPVLLCVLMLMTLAACQKGTNSSGQSGGQGTLNLADTGPITLDPATAAESNSASYIFQIFSGLVRLDQNLQVVQDIASSWDVSADGMTYTFHLRRGVTFHDGKPVTAADFKYSWERALTPATGSLTAGTYLNDIVGAGDMLAGRATSLSGVKVLDDYTLEVTIDAPKAYFLDKMAYPTSFVVDKANVASGANWWQKPNGTGPFKLVEWQPDQLLVLGRNENYYGDKARLNEVRFQLYNGNPLQLYQSGDIDVTYVGGAYMGLVTDPSNPVSKELHVSPELSIFYIGFNASAPPFDDVNVRQAFSYAVDKERLLDLSTENTVTPAYGILPPEMPGYNPDLPGLRFDPQKAKQLIAASKYGSVANLPPIVLTTSGYGGDISSLVGGVIEEWRRNLGVEVTVRQLEPQFFLYLLKQEKNNLFDLGWIADYPDPQDFIDILFRTGSQNNAGEYSNPQLDALLDRAAVEQDHAARLDMYRQAEEMVVQDAAILPLYFGRSYLLVKPYVTDYQLSPLGYAFLNLVSVQPH